MSSVLLKQNKSVYNKASFRYVFCNKNTTYGIVMIYGYSNFSKTYVLVNKLHLWNFFDVCIVHRNQLCK